MTGSGSAVSTMVSSVIIFKGRADLDKPRVGTRYLVEVSG